MPSVNKAELENTMEWLAASYADDLAYVCRKTGKIYWVPEDPSVAGEDFAVPADIEDTDRYVSVPDKRDLDLGSTLVFDFIGDYLPNNYDQVRSMFRREGAYRQFKDLLDRKGKLQAWYDFSDECSDRALAQWCKDEGLILEAAEPTDAGKQ